MMEGLDRLSGEIGIVLFVYAVLAALLVVYLCLRAAKGQRPRSYLEGIFLAVSLAVMAFAWLPLFAYNLPLNPDEVQMIANAQKFTTDMMTWRSVDTTTSGPLNSMVLMWPIAFGGDVSIPSARLTTVVLAAGTWLFTYFALAGTQPAIRVGILATLLVFFAGAQFFDFTHYSSERLSMFLLSIATLVTVVVARGYRGRHLLPLLFVTGVLLGSVPFAKLQASPIAVVWGAALAGLIAFGDGDRRNKLANLSALALGAILTPAVILVPLAFTDGLTNFWMSYIGFALHYVTAPITTLSQFVSMMKADQLLVWFMVSTATLSLAGVVLWLLGFIKPTFDQRVLAGILLLVVVTSIYAILRPGRGFNHYLLFLPVPFAVFAGLLWPSAGQSPAPSLPRWSVWLGAVIPAAALLLQGTHALGAKYDRRLEVTGAEEFFHSGDLLDWLPARPPRMLVWGWMSEWYVYSGLRPATRDIHNQNQLVSFDVNYYRRRLVRDFDPLRTSVVVDACAPGSYFCTEPRRGLSSFPELAGPVNKNFTALTPHSDVAIPVTYLRNDLVPELRRSLVPIDKITASSYLSKDGANFPPERVNDFSVYDTGHDYWLLPDGKLGWLGLDLNSVQPISEVWILNTRDDFWGDRAARYIYVDVLSGGKLLYRIRVKAKRFPYWTKVRLSAEGLAADGLRVTVLKFAGKGGGINEIKLLTPYGAKNQAAIDRAIGGE